MMKAYLYEHLELLFTFSVNFGQLDIPDSCISSVLQQTLYTLFKFMMYCQA